MCVGGGLWVCVWGGWKGGLWVCGGARGGFTAVSSKLQIAKALCASIRVSPTDAIRSSPAQLYVSWKFIISALTGAGVGVTLQLCTVDLAAMFGVLTFFLNFIPTVGLLLAVRGPALAVCLCTQNIAQKASPFSVARLKMDLPFHNRLVYNRVHRTSASPLRMLTELLPSGEALAGAAAPRAASQETGGM